MEEAMYTVKVGEATPSAGGRPSSGPVYRSIYAKDGLMQLPQEIQSPWDFRFPVIRGAVKKYPKNKILGRRQVSDGKAGDYVWQTYEQVHQKVIKIGAAIRSFGVKTGLTVPYMDPTALNGSWPCRLATAKEFVMCHCMTPLEKMQLNSSWTMLRSP